MRKSREFDSVLDTCLERLLVGNETVEQCLQRFPQYADELKPLLETALVVKQASDIQPRLELKDRARYQFHSALEEMGQKKRLSFFNWQPRWATVLAAVLVFLLASSGTVAAAENSMPDEPLYPVKLATEQVRLVLTPSKLGKVELYAELADRRVSEILSMADKNKPEKIERATRRLDAYLMQIAALSSVPELSGGVAMVPSTAKAPVTGEVQPTEEAGIAKKAPALLKAPLPEAASVPEGVPSPSARAEDAKGKRLKGDQRAKLRETMERRAADHSARLHALLEKVPASARPALLRAIAVSETGYQKALEALED